MINTCTPTSYRFSHTSIFAGPGRINCRRQLRSAPGLLRSPKACQDWKCMLPVLHCSFFFLFFFLFVVFLQLTFLTEGKQVKKGVPKFRKKSGKIDPEINLFFASIFEWIVHGFGLNFESFFNDFSCCFHCLFEAVFLMIFNGFLIVL